MNVNQAKNSVTCPICGSPATCAGTCEFRFEGKSGIVITDLYRCTNDSCTQKVPYPGEDNGDYSDWALEFVIIGGKKQIVRPSANEFA